MSKYQSLRDLVNERLAAAAEEVFALIERTIVDYEDELCRCRVEIERKQQQLDQAWNPCVVLHREEASPPHAISTSPELCLQQEDTERKRGREAHIKEEPEEQGIKEEPPLSSAGDVKGKKPKMHTQKQTEHQVEIISEPHFHSQAERHMELSSDTYNDHEWEPLASCSDAQMEAEAHGELYSHVQTTGMHTSALYTTVFPQYSSAPGTSSAGHYGNVSEIGLGAKGGNYQCSICQKGFRRKMELQRHLRVHTGERPYCCSICTKTFTQKIHLEVHMRIHSSEKPYACTLCSKSFAQKVHLKVHFRTHTGERPYICYVCEKTFTQRVYLQKHMSIHIEGTHEQNQ